MHLVGKQNTANLLDRILEIIGDRLMRDSNVGVIRHRGQLTVCN